jgi:hypothetical protein
LIRLERDDPTRGVELRQDPFVEKHHSRDCLDAEVPRYCVVAADVDDREALEWRVRGAEGEWFERHTISQDLPQLATDALVAGWDTQSLRVLAGEAPDAYPLDLGDLFARALKELGRPVPSPARARWLFVQYLCWLVVTDQVSPLDGAKRVERIRCWQSPEVLELAHISALVDEWEGEWGRGRPAVETELRRATQELLARPLPD